MACGEFGEGKMSSPRQIFVYLKNYFDKKNIVREKNLKALVLILYPNLVIIF